MKRNSNIELLRIVCMVLVVAHHYSVHGAWGDSLSPNNAQLVKLLGVGGKLAVNCFVLITGYFGVKSFTNTKNKILRLWKDRLFYSVLISVFFVFVCGYAVDSSYLLRAFFPILTCRHNYITTFVMLYFFIPYINKFMQIISQKELTVFLLTSTVILSIVPTVVSLTSLYTNNTYSYLLWMMYLYCIGAYMQLYPIKLPWKLLSIISVMVLLLMTFVVEPMSVIIPNGYTVGMQNNFVLLLCCVSILAAFSSLNIGYNRFINGIASSTFAVLLIHDDPLVRNAIWSQVFKNAEYGGSPNLWVHSLCTIIIVYLFCIIVDKIYCWGIKGAISKIVKHYKDCREKI